MTSASVLRMDDLEDPGSAALRGGTDAGAVEVMVIRRGDRLDAYVNVCPHVALPLDFRPGRFLNVGRTHILCANHGALFRIDDGVCIAGPCVHARLRRAFLTVADSGIRLAGVESDGSAD